MIRPVGNKNALDREVGADGLRDWSYGLLDCCAVPRLCTTTNSIGPSLLFLFFFETPFFSGCWATFCPCIVYGQNKQRLRHLHHRHRPLAGGGDNFNQHCRAYCCMAVPCFYWVFQVCRNGLDSKQVPVLRGAQMGSRADIRNRYDIRGDSVEDCLSSLCCRSCALAQERREIELEEKSFS